MWKFSFLLFAFHTFGKGESRLCSSPNLCFHTCGYYHKHQLANKSFKVLSQQYYLMYYMYSHHKGQMDPNHQQQFIQKNNKAFFSFPFACHLNQSLLILSWHETSFVDHSHGQRTKFAPYYHYAMAQFLLPPLPPSLLRVHQSATFKATKKTMSELPSLIGVYTKLEGHSYAYIIQVTPKIDVSGGI